MSDLTPLVSWARQELYLEPNKALSQSYAADLVYCVEHLQAEVERLRKENEALRAVVDDSRAAKARCVIREARDE